MLGSNVLGNVLSGETGMSKGKFFKKLKKIFIIF
jgi:hypothetical protein